MTKKALEIKNLTLKFGKNVVLDDISIDVEEGEFLFIVGPNSSGKSTLIKSILGLLKPAAGEINIYGEANSQEVISKYFGYIPQYTTIDRTFPMTVEEFISLECDASKCDRHPHDHLDIFGDTYLLKKKIGELSGGEMQKVLIAKALVTDPKILVLDEPGNHLDTESQSELYSFLKNYDKEGDKTILLISHDHNVIEEHTDRVLQLSNRKATYKKILDIHHKHI